MIDVPDAPSAPLAQPDAPEAWYRDRHDRFRGEAAALAEQAARLANLRLLLFLGAAAAAVWAFWSEPPLAPILWLVAAAAAAGFVVLVGRYRRVERRRRHLSGLADLAAEALARIARDWPALPLRHAERADPAHPYAGDLDLFGRGSLLQLTEAVGTRLGADTLRAWLLQPADPATVRARQAAVAELAPLAAWREELVWRGRATGTPSPDPEPLLAWAEGEPFLARRQALLWGARLSPPLLWALLLAQGAGLLGWPLWLLPLAANLLIGWRLVGEAVRRLNQVRYVGGALGAYADALEHLASASFTAPRLRRLQDALQSNGTAAPQAIRRLGSILRLAQPPASMVYPLIELATLWNVHVLSLLEGWQAAHGRRARSWLVALGEAEALAALARLRHDNPAWALPEIDPAATRFAATALGHPLLPAAGRVTNDLALGPSGTFLLVTGSNMSGKSTLLRAVGLNAVLAQAGGPVCATSLRMPPLAVWTSMRVSDSLERGVSFFMAELERLKLVVDAAQAAGPLPPGPETGELSTPAPDTDRSWRWRAPPPEGPLAHAHGGEGDSVKGTHGAAAPVPSNAAASAPEAVPGVLYLLDEILQGTNTAERQIAARRVIRLLLACRAIGAVSTHDLTLADAPDLAAAAQAVHLTETVTDGADGARMTFDYRLRPGVARSTNALRLLDLVGLVEPS